MDKSLEDRNATASVVSEGPKSCSNPNGSRFANLDLNDMKGVEMEVEDFLARATAKTVKAPSKESVGMSQRIRQLSIQLEAVRM